MNNTILKSLLIEYDKKKRNAEEAAEKNKYNLYEDFPQIADIDNQINSLALSTMKEIAQNGNSDLINKLNIQIENLKNKKSNILKDIGERAKSIYPHYECSKCNDTGYVLVNGRSQMCNCLKQKIYDIEYNKSNMNSLVNQNFDKFNLQFYSTDVNSEQYQSDISPRENMELILKICHNFIDNFDDIEEKSLLFTGKTGLR